MLQTVLVENTLKDEVQERPLKLNLSLGLERFKTIKEKLAGILRNTALNNTSIALSNYAYE